MLSLGRRIAEERVGSAAEEGTGGDGEVLEVAAIVPGRLETEFPEAKRDVLGRDLESRLAAVAPRELIAG